MVHVSAGIRGTDGTASQSFQTRPLPLGYPSEGTVEAGGSLQTKHLNR
jgi:hypothetical protein